MSAFEAQRISARYLQPDLPDTEQRVRDALDLMDLGYAAVLGVDCIQDQDYVQALSAELHISKNDINSGIVGPHVLINEPEATAFAPLGVAFWRRKESE